jgi:hypothetical protein
VSVLVEGGGLRVLSDALVEGEVALPCRAKGCAAGYDFDGLERVVRGVVAAHPALKQVVVVPEPRVPYEALIGAIDAARGPRGELLPFAVLASGAP